jgi:hypothetical protein
MATVTFFQNLFLVTIPAHGDSNGHGTDYFWLGPEDVFRFGAVTVSAFGPGAMLEVIQMATRSTQGGTYLDIVVQNNGDTDVTGFYAFTGVISPD